MSACDSFKTSNLSYSMDSRTAVDRSPRQNVPAAKAAPLSQVEQPNHLYDPRRGDPPIRVGQLERIQQPHEPPRTNCFAIYLIESGSGVCWANASQFSYESPALLFFVPYQHIRLVPQQPTAGQFIYFHANFLCVETFHAEVGCSGILFNDPYGTPVVPLNNQAFRQVSRLLKNLQTEQRDQALAGGEIMLAYLKILLILATRLKTSQTACGPTAADPQHPVLGELRELIEANYHSLHAPADYAKLLHIAPKTLGRIVREQLGATPTELIRNRILIHAKWQLLHTLKPVKKIARELGFNDELYFSRLFKKATGYSPTYFREFETEIRGGSNLSMT